MPKEKIRTWERFARRQATDFLILYLIASGLDPNEELVADGESCPFFEKVAKELDIDWDTEFPKPGQNKADNGRSIPAKKIYDQMGILACAKKIGYEGKTLAGITAYLRGLP